MCNPLLLRVIQAFITPRPFGDGIASLAYCALYRAGRAMMAPCSVKAKGGPFRASVEID